MKKICLFIIFLIISCKSTHYNYSSCSIKHDIIYGKKFFSINILAETNTIYIVRGIYSNYSYDTSVFTIQEADTSSILKVNSLKAYHEKLEKLSKKGISQSGVTDGVRMIIYKNKEIIYDRYDFNDQYDLLSSITNKFPSRFNPFFVSNFLSED